MNSIQILLGFVECMESLEEFWHDQQHDVTN